MLQGLLRVSVMLMCSTGLLLSAETAPLTARLNELAQAQLRARAKTIEAITDVPAAEKRKAHVRAKLLELIGGLPDYKGPLNATVTKTIARDGYVIENVIFESLPDYYVTANLYRPKAGGRHPAVLMSMGHWDTGKIAAQVLSSNLARKGFVVLAYDPVGQGERQQAYDPRVGRSIIGGATEQHFLNGAQAILLGLNVARYFIWDGMRAIDYLVSRPEVDASRIGATGCSGGGTQTTYIAALDSRVKVAAPACYMNSFQVLYSGSVGDSEQSTPGFLASGLDQTDYVELFAPKPWLISSTERDFFTPAGARVVYEEARRWYKLYKAEDRIKWVVGPGGHGTPKVVREAIYGWMIRWLLDGAGDTREAQLDFVPDHELRVTERGRIPGRELYQIISGTRRQPGNAEELRQFVNELISQNRPLLQNVKILPESAGSTKRPAVVLIENSLTPTAQANDLVERGNVVVIVSPSGAGGDAVRPRSGNWLNNTRSWLVGRNLPAMHAAEIVAAARLAATRPDVDPGRISARATGVSGVWLLLAAAAGGPFSEVHLERTPHSYRAAIEAPVHTNLHDAVIPGFALKWDLEDLRQLAGSGRVQWTNPTDWMGNIVRSDGPFLYTTTDPNAK